ncbi:endo-1,4-beta-xylanase [Streptomyces sp. NA04227]|uniref:endo-1,4-beta-xylanase n=1 Tax=Streptomyces sp. NA04227 TaxID=2742136 RepID=UPI0015911946|nr:endo-1,4-beta-xylanase [Streptomyces sp. NA04227]QKW08361.1 endo-1,4-beta-xylanase [Streptomyces sp. NA04227]
MHAPRRNSPRAGLWAMPTALALLLATGCGSGDGDPAPPSPSQSTGPSPTAPGERTMRQLAEERGKYMGVAVDADALGEESPYPRLAGEQFGMLTAENAMKWPQTERSPGSTSYEDADRVVDFAKRHRQRLRGHALTWNTHEPQWLSAQKFSDERIGELLREHVQDEAGRYKGAIYAWDVVNEPLTGKGTLKPGTLLDALGPDYIADSLRWAHQADPDARLYLNEFGAEGIGPKSDGLYRLAKSLKEKGVPLHGIGFESHFELGKVPKDMRQNMERFTALGLEVAVTELDVRMRTPATDDALERQAEDYASVIRTCLNVEKCVGVSFWNLHDGASHVPKKRPGWGAAHAYDAQYRPKPAREAVAEALTEEGG